MINFGCPTCGGQMSVPANMAGGTANCPKCGTLIQVPAAAAEHVASPRPGLLRRPSSSSNAAAALAEYASRCVSRLAGVSFLTERGEGMSRSSGE